MTLPLALKKAILIVRGGGRGKDTKRSAYLQAPRVRYRLLPSTTHPRGYEISMSVHYNGEWQPWDSVDSFGGFGVDDILYDKWVVV
jgi:hypothetical protein